MSAFVLAILQSLDSLIGGAIAGPLISNWRRRTAYAAAFGVCDGLGTLLGGLTPRTLPDLPSFAVYLTAVVALAVGAWWSRWWLLALPVLFALDNFAEGGSWNDAIFNGAVSFAAAGFGILIGVGLWRAARQAQRAS